jgi:hypothetical protein
MKTPKTSRWGPRLLAAGLLCCAALSGQAQNLVQNPSFGTNTTASGNDWSYNANGTYFYYNTTDSVDVNVCSMGWTTDLGIWQNTGAAIQAGASYTFTVTAQVGQATCAGLILSFQDVTKGWVTLMQATNTFTSQSQGPTDWETFTMTIPSSLLAANLGDTIGVTIDLYDPAQGWAWIDNVSLTAQGTLEPAAPQGPQFLYTTNGATSWRDDYTGEEGCQFTVGTEPVIVDYLGYFSTNVVDGLAIDHDVGVYTAVLSAPVLLGSVVVPSGTSAYYTNGFYWVQLNPPLLLAANATYVVAASQATDDGDWWYDAFQPTFDTYFVGANASLAQNAYSPGSAGWPMPSYSTWGNGYTYGAEGLAYMQMGPAGVAVLQTNVNIAVGTTLTLAGCGAGQSPITNVWWKVGSPSEAVLTTTNPYAYLVISNVAVADSGTYVLTASNALGGAQSSNVTVTVSGNPVGITAQPTNVAAFNNYPINISMTATGTPPIYYQWYLSGTAIPGATASNYSVFVSNAMSGNAYSCVASNYVGGTGYTATSHTATLTVMANLAYPQEFLHGYNSTLDNNTYAGQQGGEITIGSNSVLVTHLGYYAWPANCTTNGGGVTCSLALDHHVGIYYVPSGVGSGATLGLSNLLGYVVVPAGNNTVINGYMWQPLDPPLVLTNATTYLLEAETLSDDDWGDTYILPDLNPYFATSCAAVYGGYGWGSGPYLGGLYGGQMYSAPNLAVLALPAPSAFVVPLVQTQYANLSATFTATVVGQAPVTVQWGVEPSTLLRGQTNASLTLSNLTLAQSNSFYYAIATNALTAASDQSTDAVLDVIADIGPAITNDIVGQVAYEFQTVQFTLGVDGTPSFGYEWTFNGHAIPGAAGPTLTLTDLSSAYAGNYQVIVTNNYGSATSSVANLQIIVPAWGGYASGVMNTNLLLYYRFSDIFDYDNYGVAVATNQGSLGPAHNGTYEGTYEVGCSLALGPTNILDLDEATNLAVLMDGLTGDVSVPSASVTLTNCTIAAWVMDGGGQADNATIFFQRQSSVFGLAIGQNGTGEWLKYTWNNAFYGNNTGLVLPTNQWAFVAMVINPTNATIYLQNGTSMSSTNFAGTYPPQSLSGVSYVGWDTAGGATGRRWNGDIDEVMVLDQAYSAAQVNSLYLGVPPTATLAIVRSGSHNAVTWPGGTLEESTSLAGPWTHTVGATNGLYLLPSSPASKFYRVQLQPR